jgi:exodeoxyribonuclease VII large subunit
MAFNDERVVRRVARMRVPTVSAIGHEIDTTLTDLVADVRAATPSQAAELVVPDFQRRVNDLRATCRRLCRATRARLLEDRAAVHDLFSRLGDPRFVMAQRQQELDELRARAERALRRRLASSSAEGRALQRRLLSRHPRVVVANWRTKLGPLSQRLRATMRLSLQGAVNQLGSERARLLALSPFGVLSRGYAIALTESGHVLTDAGAVRPGDKVRIRLREGGLRTEVLGADEVES